MATSPAPTDDVYRRLQAIVIDKLEVSEAAVQPAAQYVNDLGADSLDLVELHMEIEKEFNLAIPDADAEQQQTVGETYAYLKAHLPAK